MSRLGKKPIEIPAKTEVKKEGSMITVKGPLGTLSREFRDDINIEINGQEIVLVPKSETKANNALWGTYASHLLNMVSGVNKNFEKKLIVEGVGYKAELSGNKITLSLGYSHKIEVVIPEGLNATVEKNAITISGIDKERVGQLAAQIRAYKTPEPYKGKGIRYHDEVIHRKQGKKSA